MSVRRPVRAARRLAILAPALALSACAQPSAKEHFAALQASLLAKGGLRTEIAPADAPYDRGDLERNFRLIAFRTEFPRSGDIIDERPLSKWRLPVTWRMIGDDRPSDHARMRALGARISEATGLEVREAAKDERARMLIMYLGPETRPAMRRALGQEMSDSSLEMFDLWASQLWVVCYATTFHGGDDDWTSGAMIGIRDELPDLLRDSCLDEEVVQAMGLPNDDATVRPSIFNDDEEFAFMTRHDADLLRILYDPRLKPGMTEAEAAPIVREIVSGMTDVPPADPARARPALRKPAKPAPRAPQASLDLPVPEAERGVLVPGPAGSPPWSGRTG
ncbi:DUF2927 domain-containing protein [Albimonas sp. CAU 1670]|uniref:DUF2927 domain-containing protein n=1 Tax=Albimonas sp. CAU 1670 TaxID=3032599 RepID=UPI0023DC4AA3|nr:DUF2927 domain-containing protein [Albimonas sp. CAU 1670]MDF2232796.1 DUF2927 domain-containing protein [Albimonas sp. CAU 1670]